jgi:imidazolonepropionase-like amidohydrolase
LKPGSTCSSHTAPGPSGYTPEQLARFKSQGTALVPTLSLFTTVVLDPGVTARIVAAAVSQLKQFSDNGGVVLFGTDIGFIKLYDTSTEYDLMHRALGERQVLASLTTNPATYFKAAKKGRVEKGFDADLAVLDGDPIADVRNLAKVAYTIRAGQVIYQKQ